MNAVNEPVTSKNNQTEDTGSFVWMRSMSQRRRNTLNGNNFLLQRRVFVAWNDGQSRETVWYWEYLIEFYNYKYIYI
jgi:hypothetical protein